LEGVYRQTLFLLPDEQADRYRNSTGGDQENHIVDDPYEETQKSRPTDADLLNALCTHVLRPGYC
jgi:hypothetical protein